MTVMYEMKNLLELLSVIKSADVYDNTYDDGICYDLYEEENDDPCWISGRLIQERIEPLVYRPAVKGLNPKEVVADIAKFVKEHMQVLEFISRTHMEPMRSTDPENEDAVYYGVRLVNAMQAGYATNGDYMQMIWNLDEKEFEYACIHLSKSNLELIKKECENDEYYAPLWEAIVKVRKEWEIDEE